MIKKKIYQNGVECYLNNERGLSIVLSDKIVYVKPYIYNSEKLNGSLF